MVYILSRVVYNYYMMVAKGGLEMSSIIKIARDVKDLIKESEEDFRDFDLSHSIAEAQTFDNISFWSITESMRQSEYIGCQFNKCSFYKLDMEFAEFNTSTFGDCDFDRADLHGAHFRGAVFLGTNTDFHDAAIALVDFTQSIFANVDFSGAYAPGAEFAECSLKGANFTEAILRGANFTRADLRGADFSGADLTDVEFESAIIDDTTILPEEH